MAVGRGFEGGSTWVLKDSGLCMHLCGIQCV